MNRSARRAAAAEANASRESEAFERRVPVEAAGTPVVASPPRKRPATTRTEPTSLADDEPLEGVIPARRRLDLGFGLIVDGKELRIALGEIGQRVALAKEAAVPVWTREEWAASCKGAWDATPKMGPANLREDESYDGTQDRCGRCALCAWEGCVEDLEKRYPLDDGRPKKERPPAPTIEELVDLVCSRGRVGASYESPLGALIERADVFGEPRVTDPRDREQVKAAAKRVGVWTPGRESIEVGGRARSIATPWTRRIDAKQSQSMQAKTPGWARTIEYNEEFAISWRWALSSEEARGGLSEAAAGAVVFTLARVRDEDEDERSAADRQRGLETVAAKHGRNPEQVRAIVGAILSRFRADLAARRFLPPVHPRNGAFRLYQERVAVRQRVHERAAAREARG